MYRLDWTYSAIACDVRSSRRENPTPIRVQRWPAMHPHGRRRGAAETDHGAGFRNNHDITDAWMCPIVQRCGYFIAEVGTSVDEFVVDVVT